MAPVADEVHVTLRHPSLLDEVASSSRGQGGLADGVGVHRPVEERRLGQDAKGEFARLAVLP